MNSSSKVIMAATMVMVGSLVLVLSLILVLLAELYCSFLLRRRRSHSLTLPTTTTTVAVAATTTTTTKDPSPSPLTTGVLQTPKSFFQTKTNEPSLPIPQDQIRETEEPIIITSGSNQDSDIVAVDNMVYISNPMYSNESSSTPFETPESSPSRLSSSSSEEDEDEEDKMVPMKGLPEQACSVSLRDVKCLDSCSASETEISNGNGDVSSTSASPYTSPSW